MTIGTEPPFIRYAYTAPATFDFNFRITEEEALEIYHLDGVSGDITLLELAVDYLVHLVDGVDGGQAEIIATGLSAGFLEIKRNETIDQETDYVNNDPFNMDILERSLDKLTMIDQQQQEELNRCLKIGAGEGQVPIFDLRGANGKVLEVTEDGKRVVGITSARDILQAEINSANSAAAALVSQNASLVSQNAANAWATAAENLPVDDGVNPPNFSAYHYMKKSEAMVATGVNIRNGIVDGVGDFVTDFNSMDWTGHPYSGTPATAFEILDNSLVQFLHNEVLYSWFGPKPVNVGLGGDYIAVADDLILIAANDAASTSFDPNTSTLVATDVQDAIDETDAKVEAIQTGFKNVLINGDFRVDQRRVYNGDWNNVTLHDYGPDHWLLASESLGVPGDIFQYIEDLNGLVGETYTLSWEGGSNGEGQITYGSTSVSGLSPVTATIDSLTDFGARLPATAFNIQLERGSVATSFEVRNIQQEIAMCRRYAKQYSQGSASIVARGDAVSTSLSRFLFQFDPAFHGVGNMTVTLSDLLHFNIEDSTGLHAITGVSILNLSPLSALIEVSATVTLGDRVNLITTNSNGSFLIESEL